LTRNETLIALDLGTSFIKGAVIDLERLRLGPVQRLPFPEPIPGLPPLFYEVDPAQILAAVRGLLDQLLAQAPNCAGIVTCGQMGGLILTTQQGEPLSNYISWRDQRLLTRPPARGNTYFELLEQQLSPAERSQLGNEVRPGLPVSTLFWLAEQKSLPRSRAIAATLTDFVLANLCGAAPAMDVTQATGALNLETLDWHYPVFARLGLEAVLWPALSDLREPVGHFEAGGSSLPCYAPVGDHQCALLGAYLDYRELSLNISTGSQVSLLTPQCQPGNYQTRPYFDGRFLNTISHIPAGRSLNVLMDLLSELAVAQGLPLADPWAYVEQAVGAIEDTDLMVNLAFFPSPVGQPGAVTNIHEGNLTVGHLFLAAFRNMADNYQACALRLSPGREWHSLVFSGGLAQKFGVLRRLIIDRMPGRYRLCASSEDTLLGLLVLALVVSGRAASVAAASAMVQAQEPDQHS